MKDQKLTLRLSDEEFNQLRNAADRTRTSVSQLARDRLFKQTPQFKLKLFEDKLDRQQMEINKIFVQLYNQIKVGFQKNDKYLFYINQILVELFVDLLSLMNVAIFKEKTNISLENLKARLMDPPGYINKKLARIAKEFKREELSE